jgi:hypothetical protein
MFFVSKVSNKIILLLIIGFLSVSTCSKSFFGQAISGFIFDETNNPIPFTNVYIKNTGTGTSADAKGRYYIKLNDPGVYDVIFSSIGYIRQEVKIVIKERENVAKNIWMETDEGTLNEIMVNSKRRDPAYEIIQKAIENKQKWQNQYQTSTCEVYIKAKEIISEKEKRKRDAEAEASQKKSEEEGDVFEAEKKAKDQQTAKIAGSMNMVEVQMKRYYQLPNDVKEIREGYKKYGSAQGLFYTNTSEADFNFYDNLMSLDKLNEIPVVSPLHLTSVLTYKFKLEETTMLGTRFLYKIAVTPRKKGNGSWSGHIWILDDFFTIMKVDLELDPEGLLILNTFSIKQTYEFVQDSIIVLKEQEFDYTSKGGKSLFKGKTEVAYSNYVLNPIFEKRFFKNEIVVTTQDAYDKDSTYWMKIRPLPLTLDEQKYQKIKDSIMAYHTSDKYLDSIDSVFNKVTLLDVFWDGIEFTNRKLKKTIYFSSLAGLFDPFEIGGMRVGPQVTYFKKWKSEKYLYTSVKTNIGLRNEDIKGNFSIRYRYDPIHMGTVGLWGGKLFNTITSNDALSNLFLRSNWIEENRLNFFTSRELFNGLFVSTSLKYIDRLPIDSYQFGEVTDDWFDGQNNPLEFVRYKSVIVNIGVAYTPFQKYMTEPKRKIILGSKWPTFSFFYEKGIPNFLGSEIDFDLISVDITQNIKVGTIGTSSYNARAGKFINTTDLRYVDNIIFPRGDKYFFASLMLSMQIQDTTLSVSDQYLRVNYIHHFNGALTNLIPLFNKTGLHAVVGASYLYIPQYNYQYYEFFGGLERSFKAQRARYRIGVYFVEASSTFAAIQPRVKIAFNRYNLRDNSWGF